MDLIQMVVKCGPDLAGIAFARTYTKGPSSKQRLIAIPSPRLSELHRAFITYLKSAGLPSMPNATGCSHGDSPLANALQHRGGRYFYRLDFARAFPSVESGRLAHVIRLLFPKLGEEEVIRSFLEQYCMIPGHGLAQGGPASPLLFNLYCEWEVDQRIRALLERQGNIVYTRYVDDLVFSAKERPLSPTLLKKVRRIVRQAGFTINTRKTGSLAQATHEVVSVTGTRLLPSGMCPSTDFLTRLDQAVADCLLLEERPSDALLGTIAYFESFSWHLAANRQVRRLQEKIARLPRHEPKPKQRVERFSQAQLGELRARILLKELVGQVVELKPARAGREWKGLCPFHQEKTASFFVAPEQGFYHCFGCGAHGEAISFVMRIQNMDFVRAVRHLAKIAGFSLSEGYRLVTDDRDSSPF